MSEKLSNDRINRDIRILEDLIDWLESDPAIAACQPIEDVDESLRQSGIDPEPLTKRVQQMLKE